MTNSERITAHNARLAAMKETVAELPEAGGGAAVETCTVTLNKSSDRLRLEYTTVENGEIIGKSENFSRISSEVTITMLKNSILSVINLAALEDGDESNISNISLNNGEVLYKTYDAIYMDLRHFSMLITSDGTITLS